MEELGETEVEPEVLGVSEPMLLMEKVVALVEVYERVAEPPCAMVVGVRETVQEGAAVTVTETEPYVVQDG